MRVLLSLCLPDACSTACTSVQESHLPFIDMAAFIGLACSPEQAFKVWESHRNPSPHGNFKSYPGLHADTIEWMTTIMGSLLPPPLALRWGVVPTDLPSN